MSKLPPYPSCATCPFPLKKRACYTPDGKSPDNCPTINQSEVASSGFHSCQADLENDFYKHSVTGSGKKDPRILEIINFAKRANYQKLGIAFCAGLKEEAKIVDSILKTHDFKTVSVICKFGQKRQRDLLVPTPDLPQSEILCNPAAQAQILNEAETDFNIVIGLCVGHDSIFFKYSEALTTVLVAKDRLLGHNPVAALHTAKSYYSDLFNTDSQQK